MFSLWVFIIATITYLRFKFMLPQTIVDILFTLYVA